MQDLRSGLGTAAVIVMDKSVDPIKVCDLEMCLLYDVFGVKPCVCVSICAWSEWQTPDISKKKKAKKEAEEEQPQAEKEGSEVQGKAESEQERVKRAGEKHREREQAQEAPAG